MKALEPLDDLFKKTSAHLRKPDTELQEAPEHHRTLFHYESNGTLAQVAQRGCGVSILRDTEELPGHGPGQLALDGPA